jgi:hypothetical protein
MAVKLGASYWGHASEGGLAHGPGPNNSIIVAERRQTYEGTAFDDNFAITSGGLYKYDPSANSWSRLPGTADVGFGNVATDPADNGRIVASGDGFVWRTTDGAACFYFVDDEEVGTPLRI